MSVQIALVGGRLEVIVVLVIVAVCQVDVRRVQACIAPRFVHVQMQTTHMRGQQTSDSDNAKYSGWTTHIQTIVWIGLHLIWFAQLLRFEY